LAELFVGRIQEAIDHWRDPATGLLQGQPELIRHPEDLDQPHEAEERCESVGFGAKDETTAAGGWLLHFRNGVASAPRRERSRSLTSDSGPRLPVLTGWQNDDRR
jgi:hypothetical protein